MVRAGQQTLTPRWFVAARHDGTSAPPLVNGIVVGSRTDLEAFEATAGFRVTPDVTLRSSYYTRRFYGSTDWVNQVGVSAVWARQVVVTMRSILFYISGHGFGHASRID